MLIVLKEPIKMPDHEVLAVNVETFSMIITSNFDGKYELAFAKYFDGHFSNQSSMRCTLGIFDTPEDCLNLFHEMLDALKTGDPMFDLRSKNPKGASVDDKQNQRSGIL